MTSAWRSTPLGEVLTERREEPSDEDLASGRIRIVEKISFASGTVQLRENSSTRTGMILVRPGDLLVSGINAAKGAIAVYDESTSQPAAATIHYGAYVPKRERVDVRFLWWMLRSRFFRELLFEYVPGVIKTELKPKRLRPIPVPLPPLPEQQRIVGRLEVLSKEVDAARALRRQVADEVDALLISYQRNMFRAPADGSWTTERLEDVCEQMIDYRGRTPPTNESGIPHITSANIKGGLINWETRRFVTEATYSEYMTRGIPRAQDVLFTMEAPLGEVGVVLDDRKFSLAQRIILLRPRKDMLSGDFLAKAIASPDVRADIFSRATATTVSGIASKRLKEVRIPVPPLARQRRIVDELDSFQTEVSRMRDQQNQTSAELDALLPAILDRAFKGELC